MRKRPAAVSLPRGTAEPSLAGLRLAAEFVRLTRLAEAPEAAFTRQDWLAWEVRYWALAVSLARIGQLYAELARRQGRERATLALEKALGDAWAEVTSSAMQAA